MQFFPTKSSLVSLTEPPFFAIDCTDIEIAHFERVNLSVKNFDMVFVYKDYANFRRISSIPMEQLDTIKEWLNDSDVLYTEGPISLNWSAILQQIRSDIDLSSLTLTVGQLSNLGKFWPTFINILRAPSP